MGSASVKLNFQLLQLIATCRAFDGCTSISPLVHTVICSSIYWRNQTGGLVFQRPSLKFGVPRSDLPGNFVPAPRPDNAFALCHPVGAVGNAVQHLWFPLALLDQKFAHPSDCREPAQCLHLPLFVSFYLPRLQLPHKEPTTLLTSRNWSRVKNAKNIQRLIGNRFKLCPEPLFQQ